MFFFGFFILPMVLLGLHVGRSVAGAHSGARARSGALAVTQNHKNKGQTQITKNTLFQTTMGPAEAMDLIGPMVA